MRLVDKYGCQPDRRTRERLESLLNISGSALYSSYPHTYVCFNYIKDYIMQLSVFGNMKCISRFRCTFCVSGDITDNKSTKSIANIVDILNSLQT